MTILLELPKMAMDKDGNGAGWSKLTTPLVCRRLLCAMARIGVIICSERIAERAARRNSPQLQPSVNHKLSARGPGIEQLGRRAGIGSRRSSSSLLLPWRPPALDTRTSGQHRLRGSGMASARACSTHATQGTIQRAPPLAGGKGVL